MSTLVISNNWLATCKGKCFFSICLFICLFFLQTKSLSATEMDTKEYLTFFNGTGPPVAVAVKKYIHTYSINSVHYIYRSKSRELFSLWLFQVNT